MVVSIDDNNTITMYPATMSEYLKERNKCIGYVMCSLHDSKESFTRKGFEMLALEYQELKGIRINTPVKHLPITELTIMSRQLIEGGWNFVSYDRVHNALKTLVKQGYLTANLVNGYFVYSFTSKNLF